MKLSDAELASINLADMETNLAKEQLTVHQLSLENQNLRMKIGQLELNAKTAMVNEAKKKLKAKQDSARENLKAIAKHHKLKDGWGFDPLTGEIIQEG